MSALGHKQTFAAQKSMSALPPKADMCAAGRPPPRHPRCCPRQRGRGGRGAAGRGLTTAKRRASHNQGRADKRSAFRLSRRSPQPGSRWETLVWGPAPPQLEHGQGLAEQGCGFPAGPAGKCSGGRPGERPTRAEANALRLSALRLLCRAFVPLLILKNQGIPLTLGQQFRYVLRSMCSPTAIECMGGFPIPIFIRVGCRPWEFEITQDPEISISRLGLSHVAEHDWLGGSRELKVQYFG